MSHGILSFLTGFFLFLSSIFQGGTTAEPPAEHILSFELEDGTLILDQENVASASVQVQSDPAGMQRYIVLVTFDEEGKEKFAQATTEHLGEAINIIVNGEIVSAPVVQTPITEGSCMITGDFTLDEAEELADMLN